MSFSQTMTPATNQFNSGYAYDAAGNVLIDILTEHSCSGGNAYAWDAEERMTCAGGANYTYDGDGNRVEKNGGSGVTPTLYFDDNVETDLNGNETSVYVFFNGQRIARRDPSTGNVYYFFRDELGSSNVVATQGAAPNYQVENESDFYPYGGEYVVTHGLADQHFKFTGKERDPETGLDNFLARYYNSRVGRFESPDWANKAEPVPYAKLDNPQTLNLYGYVANNPESRVDPDGHLMTIYQLYSWHSGAQDQMSIVMGNMGELAWQALAAQANKPQPAPPAQQQSQNQSSTTTTVTVNSRPANIPGGQLLHDAGVNHEWITTPDGTSVGMGTAQGVPQSDAPGVQTQVVDHTGQVPTSTQTFTGVDKAALATYTKVGTPTGRWIPGVNDCNTWVTNVIGQSTPHNIYSGFDPTGVPPHILYRNVVVYADGSIHSPGGQ